MPVSVVVGGQYGSEGKGKATLHLVRRLANVAAVVRVGGSNSGHTVVAPDGRTVALRQIPAGAVDGNVKVLIPAGSYIDLDVLLQEIAGLRLDPKLLTISPFAHVITEAHKRWERASQLRESIGSTQSGTGAAVLSRVARGAADFPPAVRAEDIGQLDGYLGDPTGEARQMLDRGDRVVIEGTQGFGLSNIHADAWPKATSRDTSAAAFVAETGLSPLDVDDVTMVIRCHPIRVAGRQSGPLPHETSWAAIAAASGSSEDLTERTTVTQAVRRVGHFDAAVVKRAIAVNNPTRIVLNHLDYVDPQVRTGQLTGKARTFVREVTNAIGRPVDWVGCSPAAILDYATESA